MEDLMKPRFKVIADYPFNKHFELGAIIELLYLDERGHLKKSERYAQVEGKENQAPVLNINFYESDFKKYPHLFKRLEWWEHRDEFTPMPMYLKETATNEIVEVHVFCAGFNMFYYHNIEGLKKLGLSKLYEPATESEYQEYIKNK